MYIGVDPGLTGAIACLSASGVYISVLDLPTMASGAKRGAVKNRVNVAGVKQILNGWLGDNDPDLSCVYLEDPEPMPRFADGKRIQPGSAGVKSLGLSIGLIEGLCIGMGIRIELVKPNIWKGYSGLPRDKEICRAKAIALYPRAPLSAKAHHNRAEAILLARYGWIRAAVALRQAQGEAVQPF